MVKNILFYYPSNKRSIVFNTQIKHLVDLGYKVTLLTTSESGMLHSDFKSYGVNCFSKKPIVSRFGLDYLYNFLYLIYFCKRHKIDAVLSHLQQANIVAVLSQYFIKAKVIIFRHHFRYEMISNETGLKPNQTEKIFDKIINKLSEKMIVPANAIKEHIILFEEIKTDKIKILPYSYTFSDYSSNISSTENIRKKYPCKLMLLFCSRLIDYKRPLLAIELMNRLVHKHKLDINMILLDEGPLKDNVLLSIAGSKLNSAVHYIGYTNNFHNYMLASDLLIHPSLTDASSSVVKEMANFGKTVAVIDGVGDFNEYIENGVNGFLIDPKNSIDQYENLLLSIYNGKYDLSEMGRALNFSVMKKFGDIKGYSLLLKGIIEN